MCCHCYCVNIMSLDKWAIITTHAIPLGRTSNASLYQPTQSHSCTTKKDTIIVSQDVHNTYCFISDCAHQIMLQIMGNNKALPQFFLEAVTIVRS